MRRALSPAGACSGARITAFDARVAFGGQGRRCSRAVRERVSPPPVRALVRVSPHLTPESRWRARSPLQFPPPARALVRVSPHLTPESHVAGERSPRSFRCYRGHRLRASPWETGYRTCPLFCVREGTGAEDPLARHRHWAFSFGGALSTREAPCVFAVVDPGQGRARLAGPVKAR